MNNLISNSTTWIYSSIYSSGFVVFVISCVAYLVGSIPLGLLVARVYKVRDLIQSSNGNIGATYVVKTVGIWPAGCIAFLLDVLKGALVVSLVTPVGLHLIGAIGSGYPMGSFELSVPEMWLAGFFTVLGHCYSPWVHFKGGKGVATGLGVFLILSPISALFGILGFSLVFFYKKIISLASIAGVLTSSAALLVLNQVGPGLWVAAALVFLILARHETNIDALLENREKPFK